MTPAKQWSPASASIPVVGWCGFLALCSLLCLVLRCSGVHLCCTAPTAFCGACRTCASCLLHCLQLGQPLAWGDYLCLLPELLITTHTLRLPIENGGLLFLHAAGSAPAKRCSLRNEKSYGREGQKSIFATRKLAVPYVSYDTIASWPRSALTWGKEEEVSHHLGFCISAVCPGLWLCATGGRCRLHWYVMREGLNCLCMDIRNERTPKWGDCMAAALQLHLLVELRGNSDLIPLWSSERGDS